MKIKLLIFFFILLTSVCLFRYYNADKYYEAGKNLLDKKNYKEAIPLLKKSVELNPTAANYRAPAENKETPEEKSATFFRENLLDTSSLNWPYNTGYGIYMHIGIYSISAIFISMPLLLSYRGYKFLAGKGKGR